MRAVRHSCLVIFCGISQRPFIEGPSVEARQTPLPYSLDCGPERLVSIAVEPPCLHAQGDFQTARLPCQISTSLISLTLSNLARWTSLQQTPVPPRQPLMCILFAQSGSVGVNLNCKVGHDQRTTARTEPSADPPYTPGLCFLRPSC